ncbi:hypothetical protein AMS68_001581 [Peltaster fructicola]|uniref:Uncharacterized protein n=1 Tax=Peltaster fructicola TaxID=286661 RepID=A0A6H0XMV7_9PEZI|nr:hypothetical protein AMS68_001581 [Peltaster fructicola]
MPSHQHYLWEHAVLLFHSFEYQASADLFAVLSTCAATLQDRQRCIVNHGLVHARMGDIATAKLTFQEAIELDHPSIIARCVMAEVEAFEGNVRQARYWYESCTRSFTGRLRADELYNFGYCPTEDVLTANIKALATSTGIKNDLANSAIGFERIPANCVFLPSSAACSDSSKRCWTTTPSQRHRESTGVLSVVLEEAETTDARSKHLAVARRAYSVGSVDVARPRSTALANPARSRPKLEARNATGRSEPLAELADFLRNAGPADGEQALVDHKYLQRLLIKAGLDPRHGEEPEEFVSFCDTVMKDMQRRSARSD